MQLTDSDKWKPLEFPPPLEYSMENFKLVQSSNVRRPLRLALLDLRNEASAAWVANSRKQDHWVCKCSVGSPISASIIWLTKYAGCSTCLPRFISKPNPHFSPRFSPSLMKKRKDTFQGRNWSWFIAQHAVIIAKRHRSADMRVSRCSDTGCRGMSCMPSRLKNLIRRSKLWMLRVSTTTALSNTIWAAWTCIGFENLWCASFTDLWLCYVHPSNASGSKTELGYCFG